MRFAWPLAALVCATALAGDADAPMKVFILAGQSNIVGRAPSRDLPDAFKTPPANVKFYRDGKWVALEASDKQFGPEIGFGHEMAKRWPGQRIGIIKVAKGGSPLSDWLDKGDMLAQLNKTLQEVRKDGKLEFCAFIWGQGLADAKKPGLAKDRAANLQRLIQSVRDELKAPELPFIFSQMPSEVGKTPDGELVRKGNEDAAKTIPHTTLVSTENLTYVDAVHYDAPGSLEYGKRFAEAVVTIAKTDAKK